MAGYVKNCNQPPGHPQQLHRKIGAPCAPKILRVKWRDSRSRRPANEINDDANVANDGSIHVEPDRPRPDPAIAVPCCGRGKRQRNSDARRLRVLGTGVGRGRDQDPHTHTHVPAPSWSDKTVNRSFMTHGFPIRSSHSRRAHSRNAGASM